MKKIHIKQRPALKKMKNNRKKNLSHRFLKSHCSIIKDLSYLEIVLYRLNSLIISIRAICTYQPVYKIYQPLTYMNL